MSRRHTAVKRIISKDIKYNNLHVAKFINYIMLDGKKDVSRKIVYNAFDVVQKKHSLNPLEVFEKSIENLKPALEVKSIRIGGSNYQVPTPVDEQRKIYLAMQWLIKSARKRTENTMQSRLAEEIFDAFNNRGTAIKMKDDVHKMAEANRSYAHFNRKKSL